MSISWLCLFFHWINDDRVRVSDRDSEKKKEGRGCVSVPLRFPRPGKNVGKVAQCLSHDPWEKAFFLLGPWMEMRCHIKPKKGTTNTSTSQHTVHVTAGAEKPALTICVYLTQLSNCHSHCENHSFIPIFMYLLVSAPHPFISKQQVTFHT